VARTLRGVESRGRCESPRPLDVSADLGHLALIDSLLPALLHGCRPRTDILFVDGGVDKLIVSRTRRYPTVIICRPVTRSRRLCGQSRRGPRLASRHNLFFLFGSIVAHNERAVAPQWGDKPSATRTAWRRAMKTASTTGASEIWLIIGPWRPSCRARTVGCGLVFVSVYLACGGEDQRSKGCLAAGCDGKGRGGSSPASCTIRNCRSWSSDIFFFHSCINTALIIFWRKKCGGSESPDISDKDAASSPI
jgi:hypothetical protein